MSAAIVTAFHHDYRDLYKGLQSHRATTDLRQQVSALTGQLVNSYAASSFINIPASTQASVSPALKHLSNLASLKSSSTKLHAPLTSSNSVANCTAASLLKSTSSTKEHRKLDRSVSEPVDRSLRPNPQNSSRYKTELCRPFEENGTCKYGDKCQFAHGYQELRNLTRHPKYKTELCRTFHTTGFCPYGPRCHFIHNSDDSKKCLLTTLQSNGGSSGNGSLSPPKLSPPLPTNGIDICGLSLGSTGDLSPTSSSGSSGSPTSSLNGFFLDENHMSSYNSLPQVPQTAPPTITNGFFFGPDYVPALTTLSTLASQQDIYPTQQQSFETEDNMLSSIQMLVSEIDNLNCLEENNINKTELLSNDENALLDANSNPRLPIFSQLAYGSSP